MKWPDYPKQVTLETATTCNAHCDFCPYCKLDRRGTIMHMELIEKVVSDLSEIPPGESPQIALNGVNEPLTDKRIFNILNLISSRLPRPRIYFVTNGNLLSGDAIAELSKHNVERLCISLNFCDAETYQRRMGLQWDKTITAMSMLHAKATSGEFPHPVYVSRVQDGSEYDTAFAEWVKLNYPSFRHVLKNAGDWLGRVPSLSHNSGKVGNGCAQWNYMHVASAGAVQFCCMDAHVEYPWGNVENTHLLDIFNQEQWVDLRRGQKTRAEVHPCDKCTYC